MLRIIVIGGGITGLATSWEIQNKTSSHPQITVVEAGNRWGGKVLTQSFDTEDGHFFTDAGPETFVTRKREIWDLVKSLDLVDETIDPGSDARNTYVLRGGRPMKLPLSPKGFITSPLLSVRGKVRMLAEPFVGRKGDNLDESIAEFVTRRLGAEASDRFLGPVLGGIYNTDPTNQSILVTSPVMRQMESESRSLVLASIKRAFQKRRVTDTDPPPSRFIGFRSGASTLIGALVEKLDADLRLNCEVTRIRPVSGGYHVELATGPDLSGEIIILTTPANASARMLADDFPDASRLLNRISHSSIGTASLGFRKEDLPESDMSGLMIPSSEGRKVDAITWPTAKMPQRAPDGFHLVRVFFGRGFPDAVTMNDLQLLGMIRNELRELLGVTAAPVGYSVARWPNSYPKATVGHLDLVNAIEETLPPGLLVTGSSYRGLAVPDCIKQANATVARATL